MIRDDLGVYLTIISHKRPGNVVKMQELVGRATWYVGDDEGADYADAGAGAVVESGALCASRNVGIRMARARGLPCVQLSDDLMRVQRAVWSVEKEKIVAQDMPFAEAVALMLDGLQQTGAKLAGVAPTANPFYANVARPVHPSAFVVGDMITVATDTELLFDQALTLKEDYDYTLQHIMTHGCVARRDDVLATFLHRKNAGGAVAVRTAELEQENIAYLKQKWPQFIRDNSKRPNEILLQLPRVRRSP